MKGPALATAAAWVLCFSFAPCASAQSVAGPTDTTTIVSDSSDVIGSARGAQARFERRRIRYFPVTFESFGGSCDEHVGRFCSWYEEGDWLPEPERREIDELRLELLAQLDEAQSRLPADSWIRGQRVWYHGERGDWEAGRRIARACGGGEAWWCAALEGLAEHELGRYVEAEGAFDRALGQMDKEDAEDWRLPIRAMDREGRALLRGLEDASPDSTRRTLDRLWLLADPLYLVEGNDRKTAHYARRTVSLVRERARNPFHISWGRDLEELTIRHGWEMGWERAPTRSLSPTEGVVGHKHPSGRDFMPPGTAVSDPASAGEAELRADRTRPRSLYAPRYAPLFLPMRGQVAAFPRGPEMAVVATYFLPPDTTRHARQGRSPPWLEAGDQAGMTDRAGLFLIPLDSGVPRSRTVRRRTDGALLIEASAGRYLVSAEVWSPERRRAGRYRTGLARSAMPENVAVLSDLVMLSPIDREPPTLALALPFLLPSAEVVPSQAFGIGWEVSGLGFRTETLRFRLSVERTDRGVVRRIGEFLRLADRPSPIELTWEEAGPVEPGHIFRYLRLDPPDLEPGRYRIRLELSTAERTDAVTALEFLVRGPPPPR